MIRNFCYNCFKNLVTIKKDETYNFIRTVSICDYCSRKGIKERESIMMVTGFLLRQILETNYDLVKKLIEETIREEISEINQSQNKFGYNYSRPVSFFECIKINGEKIFIAIQEVYEGIMRKESIIEFLTNKSCEKYNREILINFNYLDENLIFWKRKYELTKELLSKGTSKDDII